MNELWAVVPAAGFGRRMGSDLPKQYHEVAGAKLLEHTLRALLQCPDIIGVVVALDPADHRAGTLPSLHDSRVQTTTGGAERADSVLAGLDYLSKRGSSDDWVLVHDAARPCLSLEVLTALINRARALNEGVILAQPVSDTLKSVSSNGTVKQTIERSNFWRAQTPQLFPLETLRCALKDCIRKGIAVTDEAMAMELSGFAVTVLEGPPSNIKVTVEADLIFADFYLKQQLESQT